MDPRYPAAGPSSLGLDRAVDRAIRSHFFAKKLLGAGIGSGADLDWNAWHRIAPTTKEELRTLPSFKDAVCIAPEGDILEYWRSGGVTGRPLFYPRTATDVEASLTAFGRSLEFAGVTHADVFMCSLPIGIHPAGQQTVRAAERLGAACIWAGAGNQTPAATQIDLIHELGVTVWCGMPSFALHLANLAEAAGRPFRQAGVRLLVTTAEMLPNSKRALLGELWNARVVDTFGMSEVTLMGCECRVRPGLHIWRKHSFCEVLDPDSLQPAAPGAVGVLCVTPTGTGAATPFVRWLSGDIVQLEYECECAAAGEPRLVHSGRTTGFFKVKGVNLNHAEIEEALYQTPDLRDFRITLTSDSRLVVDVECASQATERVSAAVATLFETRFGCRADITTVDRGTIAKALEGQLKAQRFVDQRATS